LWRPGIMARAPLPVSHMFRRQVSRILGLRARHARPRMDGTAPELAVPPSRHHRPRRAGDSSPAAARPEATIIVSRPTAPAPRVAIVAIRTQCLRGWPQVSAVPLPWLETPYRGVTARRRSIFRRHGSRPRRARPRISLRRISRHQNARAVDIQAAGIPAKARTNTELRAS